MPIDHAAKTRRMNSQRDRGAGRLATASMPATVGGSAYRPVISRLLANSATRDCPDRSWQSTIGRVAPGAPQRSLRARVWHRPCGRPLGRGLARARTSGCRVAAQPRRSAAQRAAWVPRAHLPSNPADSGTVTPIRCRLPSDPPKSLEMTATAGAGPLFPGSGGNCREAGARQARSAGKPGQSPS
jgi:hypothetical protein